MLKFAVRWKTYRCSACLATCGISWMPVEPVPMTPTRLPASSTPSSGQRALWYQSPSKSSSPSIAGRCTDDRHPEAMTQ